MVWGHKCALKTTSFRDDTQLPSAVASDGRHVVFVRDQRTEGELHFAIFRMRVDGADVQWLTAWRLTPTDRPFRRCGAARRDGGLGCLRDVRGGTSPALVTSRCCRCCAGQ